MRRRGQGPHLAKRWEPRGFSRVAAAFSSYDGDLSLPLELWEPCFLVRLASGDPLKEESGQYPE